MGVASSREQTAQAATNGITVMANGTNNSLWAEIELDYFTSM